MNRRTLLYLAATAALAFPAFAQTKPNFTGTWKINESLTKQGPPVGNLTFKFEHKDPAFKYTATGETARGPFNESAEFTTDGKPSPAQGNGTRTSRWEGQTLIVEVQIKTFTQIWKLSLSADGKQMTRDVVNKFPQGERTSREVYDRQ